MISKSAQLVGTVVFNNGNTTAFYYGTNSNLGTGIIWQATNGRRPTRHTGKNIPALLHELNDALNEGEAKWHASRNDKLLDLLRDQYMK
jgi:hypothetical protein